MIDLAELLNSIPKEDLKIFLSSCSEKVANGIQCKHCAENTNSKCVRIGKNGHLGVCWMESSEGEY